MNRFRIAQVQPIMQSIVQAYLKEKKYDTTLALSWSQEISDEVKLRLKG